MHKLSGFASVFWLAVSVLAFGCAPERIPTLKVTLDQKQLPADGLTPAVVRVKLDPPMDGVVVRLSAGLGGLSHTTVQLRDGAGSVTVWPPFEADLGALEQTKVRINAEALLREGQTPLTAAVEYVAVPPTTGVPTLVLSADPQRVRADGATPITVHLSGRRMPAGAVVTLATDVDVGVPATVTLDDASTADIVVPARDTPVSFTLTASADGAQPFSIPLAFLSDDAPSYDLTGTFVQVSYGVVEISGMGIEPSPQVVATPTVSLVQITQTDAGFEMNWQGCSFEMPIVCIAFLGGDPEPSTTTPSPRFLEAFPPGHMSVPIRGREPGAVFEPEGSAYDHREVIGADLDNPTDALPADENDGRLVDADFDGKPGVTITNSALGSDSYLVMRMQTTHFEGAITSSDEIDGSAPGSMTGVSESSILNSGFLEQAFSPEMTARPGTFRLVRVDGRTGGINIAGNDGVPSDVSCADVRQYAAEPSTILAPPATNSCVE